MHASQAVARMMLLSRVIPQNPRRFTRTSVSVDITSSRPYASFKCLFCVKGDQSVGFFVLTLKVVRLSDHHFMIVVGCYVIDIHIIPMPSFCPSQRVLNYCPEKLRRLSHIFLIRSNLEYSSKVWDPHLRNDIH